MQPGTLLCPHCSYSMKLHRVIQRGGLPALNIYRCSWCLVDATEADQKDGGKV